MELQMGGVSVGTLGGPAVQEHIRAERAMGFGDTPTAGGNVSVFSPSSPSSPPSSLPSPVVWVVVVGGLEVVRKVGKRGISKSAFGYSWSLGVWRPAGRFLRDLECF